MNQLILWIVSEHADAFNRYMVFDVLVLSFEPISVHTL